MTSTSTTSRSLRRPAPSDSTRARRLTALCLLLLLSVACDRPDAARRLALLDSPAEQRLVGTWDATFYLDSRASLRPVGDATTAVRGVLAFAPDHHGPVSIAELDGVTHEGAYDLDFSPFRFTTPTDVPAVAMARVIPGARADSIEIVLSPGTGRFAMRMAGHLTSDSASGDWIAYAYAGNGGTGRFVMRRRTAPQ